MKKILNLFKENIDLKYKDFSSLLLPNIKKDFVLGVRIPVIRKIEKGMSNQEKKKFLVELPHKYLEENILHSIIISNIKNIDECINELDKYLDYVDNWSVCDTLICKSLEKDLNKTFIFIKKCIKSKNTYRVRFAFVCMLRYFVNDEYVDKCNEICLKHKSEEYYINMAIAWYFSYALIKEYEKTIGIFENKLLDKWVHNKSVQKAIESYRISSDRKVYLKGLRIK